MGIEKAIIEEDAKIVRLTRKLDYSTEFVWIIFDVLSEDHVTKENRIMFDGEQAEDLLERATVIFCRENVTYDDCVCHICRNLIENFC